MREHPLQDQWAPLEETGGIVLNTITHDGFHGIEVVEVPEETTVSLELLAQPTYGLKEVLTLPWPERQT